MISQLKRLGGDSLLYALMNVGTKLIAFLMLPIYTSYLSPDEMGALENIDALFAMLTFVVIFGTDSALAFFYYDTEDEKKKKDFFRNVMMFRLLVAASLFVFTVFLGDIIANLLLGGPEYKYLLYFAMVVLLFESMVTLILTYFRFNFKVSKVVIFTVVRLGLIALLSYLLLRFFMPTVDSILYSRIAATILIVLFLGSQVRRFFTFRINKVVLKEMLVYAAPLVPASIAFWVIASSNRFFLSYFESLSSVGVYGVAVKFATVITLVTSGVQMAWRPYSMSIKNKPDAKDLFAKFYIMIMLVGVIGLLGVATLIPYVFSFMIPNEIYAEATKYIALLSAGTFLNFYYLIISVGLFIEKKTSVISIYFGIAALLSLLLNVLLIPTMSLLGAALAIVLSYLTATLLIYNRSQRVYKVPVNGFKLSYIFFNGFLAMLAIVYIHEFTDFSFIYVFIPWLYFILSLVVIRIWRDVR
ncbi:lipopolysaccharide biosynthesis protein [Alkalihalobacillus deserti]|uniref:lipopolysaccharide biosynthesis protein n=1 Tax=Alkalihalobacillus deserti TaxID=2879466 RepID=UPI001D145B71|nr:oligosaccharide flippase family protein [Alkalihalobacillus deserti]